MCRTIVVRDVIAAVRWTQGKIVQVPRVSVGAWIYFLGLDAKSCPRLSDLVLPSTRVRLLAPEIELTVLSSLNNQPYLELSRASDFKCLGSWPHGFDQEIQRLVVEKGSLQD